MSSWTGDVVADGPHDIDWLPGGIGQHHSDRI
jgi:hypothetical protein